MDVGNGNLNICLVLFGGGGGRNFRGFLKGFAN